MSARVKTYARHGYAPGGRFAQLRKGAARGPRTLTKRFVSSKSRAVSLAREYPLEHRQPLLGCFGIRKADLR